MLSRTRDSSELLQESKIAYQALLDNSFDAIIAIDSEGVITTWNHRAESMFGWKVEEVIGKLLTQTIIPPSFHEAPIIHKEDQGLELANLFNCMKERRGSFAKRVGEVLSTWNYQGRKQPI